MTRITTSSICPLCGRYLRAQTLKDETATVWVYKANNGTANAKCSGYYTDDNGKADLSNKLNAQDLAIDFNNDEVLLEPLIND